MEAERLGREVVYQSPWVNLYLDKVKFPNGRVIEKYHLLDFPHAAVTALVENKEGCLIFAQISRYTTGKTEWELPAGGVEDGESVIEAANREVLEETGYLSVGHELIYSYYPMNGSANKIFHIVSCKAGELAQAFDQNEVTQVKWFTREEVREMIRERSLTDGFTVTALLLWLSGDGLRNN